MTNNTLTRRIRHRVTLPLCAIVYPRISAMGFYGAARPPVVAVYPFALQQISYYDTVNSLVYSRAIRALLVAPVRSARSIVRPRSLFRERLPMRTCASDPVHGATRVPLAVCSRCAPRLVARRSRRIVDADKT